MSKDILRDLRGFGTVEKWVLTDPKIHASAKGLYALLCAFAGDKGQAFPGTDLLRHQLGLSKNTLHKYIKQLSEFGVISIEQKRDGGQFSRNIYTLLPQGYASTVSQNLGDQKMGYQKMGDQKLDTNNNSINNNSINNTSLNNTPNPQTGADDDSKKSPAKKSSYSEQFERWWAIYPRKTAKGAAWNRWKREKLDSKVDQLIEKLEQQNALQYAFTETQYIPNASTYLNQKRYDDEVEDRSKKPSAPKSVEQDFSKKDYGDFKYPKWMLEGGKPCN